MGTDQQPHAFVHFLLLLSFFIQLHGTVYKFTCSECVCARVGTVLEDEYLKNGRYWFQWDTNGKWHTACKMDT